MRDEVLGDAPLDKDNSGKKKRRKKANSALLAASAARSATEQVHHHVKQYFANTGTNISYEGPTAPGAGGSVGTGYASGKEAVDEKMRTYSDYEHMQSGHKEADSDEYKRDDPDKGNLAD